MENNENLNNQVNTNNIEDKQMQNNNGNNKILIILMALIIVGLVGYIVYAKFIQKDDNTEPKPNNTQEEKTNVNSDVLNYQCKGEYCSDEDYANIKQLLKISDPVKGLYAGNDYKYHVVILEGSSGNKYLYSADDDNYYFKNDNVWEIELIYEGYENDGKKDITIYDYNYAVIHQKTGNNVGYKFANTKIYSFKNKKYVVEIDEYIDYNNMSCAEFENKRFYKLTSLSDGKRTLYNSDFNKIIDATDGFALDNKYIFGEIEENSEDKFFRYSIDDKKFEISKVGSGVWTYNYIAKYNNGEYEIYDFDGNSIFKTDEKTYLKNIKAKDYVLPDIPDLYYSKKENKITLILNPDICGDSSCPPHFGYSYYEYDMESGKITHKFFADNIPDDILKNLYNGYIEL